jgi:teichuronic acid biosynthesis glycosyltransferase TuaC
MNEAMGESDLGVLLVSRLYPRPGDPVLGVFVEQEARALARHCRVRVVSPVPWFPPIKLFPRWYGYSELPSHESRGGLEIFRPRTVMLPRNFLFSLLGFSFYLTLRSCLHQVAQGFSIDVIHAHTAYPDGFAAVLLGRALACPTIITLHGGDVTQYFQRYSGRKLGLWAIAHANAVIAVSSSLQHIVAEEYGVRSTTIEVIPNGVDVTRFSPMPRSEAAKPLGLQAEVRRILYVGAIAQQKGLDYLLRGFAALLPESQEPVQLILVGEGEYEHRARALAGELGIAARVVFAGQRSNEEIPLWINASDLLVLPSLREGFGVVLVEAMSCGKPVVATACGGPEDVVTPQTGILVPPADEKALAQAMLDVLRDGDRFRPPDIRQCALDNYAYDQVASRILGLYGRTARG